MDKQELDEGSLEEYLANKDETKELFDKSDSETQWRFINKFKNEGVLVLNEYWTDFEITDTFNDTKLLLALELIEPIGNNDGVKTLLKILDFNYKVSE
jgi:hypothetical protein